MRYLVDAAVFAVIFVLARMIFESSVIAVMAGVLIAGAAEAMQGANVRRS